MARQSVGELAVQIVADARQLESMLSSTEQKIQTWSQRISGMMTSPFVGGFLGGAVSGMATAAFNDIKQSAESFLGAITATGPKFEAILHPVKSAESAMQRLVDLGKDAEDIGVSPTFMRGLQIAAGPELEAVSKAVVKLMNLKAETGAGGSGEDFIRNIIRQGAAIEDAADRIHFAESKVGIKQAMGLVELFQKGPQGLDNAIAKVEKFGLATEHNIAVANEWKQVLKDINLQIEGQQNNSMLTGGLMSMGGKQMWAGDFGKGAANLVAGGENWIGQLFGHSPTMTTGQTSRFYSSLRDDMFASLERAGGDQSKIDKIQSLIDRLNESETLLKQADYRMDATLAGVLSKGAALARDIAGPAAKTAAGPSAEWYKQMEVLRGINDELVTLQLGYGKSAKEAEQLAGQVKGLNAEQLEALGQLRDMKDATAVLNANKSPMDKAREDMERIGQLRGILGDDEYRKALLRLQKQVTPAALSGDREASVALAGSQEWAKAFTRANQPIDDKAEDQLEETRKQTDLQGDIKDELKKLNERKPVPLQVPPGG